jgi:hypothetical protein
MLYCKKCGQSINGDYFQIEDCWCGGHLISNSIRVKIFDKNKDFDEILKFLPFIEEKFQKREEYLVKCLLKDDLQFKVYLIVDKGIRRPERFLLDIVKEVLCV